MASTFQAIEDTMNDMGAVVWRVVGKGGALIGYQNDATQDVQGSINRLRKLLEQQSGDLLRVELHPSPKQAKKGGDMMKVIKMDVDLSTVRAGTIAGMQTIPPGADFKELFKTIQELQQTNILLQTQLIEKKYEAQIEKLKEEINGINQNDPIGKLIDVVVPILAGSIPGMMKTQASPGDINGLPGDDLLIRLQKVDPDGYAVLNAIVVIAENNPDAYNTYKPMLINFANGK